MQSEELDLTIPLASLGVNSLVSIELRNRFRQKAGAEFTMLQGLSTRNSIMHLGEQAAAKSGEQFQGYEGRLRRG